MFHSTLVALSRNLQYVDSVGLMKNKFELYSLQLIVTL